MIASCTLLGMLGVCSIEDVRRKEVHSVLVLLFGVAGVFVHLYQRNLSIYSILAGVAVGLIVMLCSLITKGGIGMGDGLILLVTGIYLGGKGNMQLLFFGLFLSAVGSLFFLLVKKKKRKDTIPFVPYLLLAYVGMMII